MIKDNDLIHKTQEDFDTNTKTFIIKNLNKQNKKTKLGEVFKFLPNGIINKTVTGIGGTSLELDSNRNSIIVQPFNNLAESKSQLKSFENNYKVFFFSSTNFYESKNKSTKKLSTKVNDPITRLKEYIVDCEKNKQPIKIICIINQIQDLYEYLKTVKKHPIDNFYLVLDEIDTLQEHSTFRNEAAKCYNIYKVHSPEKRSMISATLMDFHDEDLKNEPQTIFKYQTSDKPNINLKYTISIKEEAIRTILNLALTDNNKIVIACNNFNYCDEIIKALIKDDILNKKTIRILCSKNQKSKSKTGGYYGEMLPDGILPADINFFTAAYFSGHDINERYHNVILAEKLSSSLRLSPRLIYQITGRCRDEKGVLSNTLVFTLNSNVNLKYNIYTEKTLIDNVSNLEALFKFTNSIKHQTNKYMKAIVESMENIFYEGTSLVPSVFEKDTGGMPIISYFKVDSRIEEQKTYKLYLNLNNFKKELDKRFKINTSIASYKKGDKKLVFKKDKYNSVKALLGLVKTLDRDMDYSTQIRAIENNIDLPITPIEYLLIKIYKNALNNENINLNKLYKAIDKIINQKQMNARLEEIEFFIRFDKFVLIDELFLENITTHFPVKEIISIDSLENKTGLVIKTFKRISKTKGANVKEIINSLIKKPVLFRNSLLQLQKKNLKNLKRFVILGYDKYQILGD
jgi:hypothetical protein